MKRSFLSLISIVLISFLIIALFPGTRSNAADISGSCGAPGSTVLWKLDDNGVLTISGIGEMRDWDDKNDMSPWRQRKDIKEVVIQKGVTKIGNYAFFECWFEKISIADTVNDIGTGAFMSCYILTNVDIPYGVKRIRSNTFTNCQKFTEIIIPGSVTSIGDSAFFFSSIRKVTIPDSVTSIEPNAFYGCGLLEEVTIPNTVTLIGDNAFNSCNRLESFSLPSNITFIREGTFKGCYKLQTIIIPDKVTMIGDSAFESCTGLQTVIIPDSVKSIGNKAFCRCSSLDTIDIPDNVQSIGNSAFEGSGLKTVNIPDSVQSIGAGAFFLCSGLETIKFPDNSLLSIEDNALLSCPNLKKIIFPDKENYFVTNMILWNATSVEYIVCNDNPIMVRFLTDACPNAKTCLFYDVGYSACDHGTVTGKNRSYIGDILELDITPDKNYIVDKVFLIDSKGDKTEIVPDTNGKYLCTMPDSEKPVTFEATFIPGGTCGDDLTWMLDDTGTLTIKGTGEMTDFDSAGPWFDIFRKSITNVIIEDGVTSIGHNAFWLCSKIEKVTIPDSVEIIDECAFEDCDNLKKITLPDNIDLMITHKAFKDCSNLEFVLLNPDCTIDPNAFEGCSDDIFHYYYDVKYTTNGNGTVTGKARSYVDDVIELSIKPAGDSVIDKVTFIDSNGKKTEITPDKNGKYIFKMPDSSKAVTFNADFKVIKPDTDPSFEDFVERLYVVALGRASEPEGKAFWTEHVGNGDLNGAQCANEFLLSKEFNDRGLTDEQFLEVLYSVFFDRVATDDPDGFNFWMNSLKTQGRDVVVDCFINSTEWCNVCATYGVKSGATRAKATIASKNATAFATRLYTECLGREPEEGGLKFWSLGLTNLELTGSAAAHEFFFCKEFNDHNFDNKELITRMYRTFMGREPDDAGMTFWLDSMGKGMTKQQVFDSFVKSPEFTQICKDYAIERG
ncbi:MAG: leucine-rich repeat protein [Clostridiales bacterium]|nr:leucine-rich repeat protein [Clostridiales bacterium]